MHVLCVRGLPPGHADSAPGRALGQGPAQDSALQRTKPANKPGQCPRNRPEPMCRRERALHACFRAFFLCMPVVPAQCGLAKPDHTLTHGRTRGSAAADEALLCQVQRVLPLREVCPPPPCPPLRLPFAVEFPALTLHSFSPGKGWPPPLQRGVVCAAMGYLNAWQDCSLTLPLVGPWLSVGADSSVSARSGAQALWGRRQAVHEV
jgi:hypothetical protein